MSFTDTFIKRPVLASVISLVIVLFGLIAFNHIPFRQYPQVELPSIDIRTVYTGADSNTMESFVTAPIESALAGIEGVDTITAVNTQGISQITVHLQPGTEVYKALSDVRDKVASVQWKLPDSVQDPVVTQSQGYYAILYLAFTSPIMTPQAMTDYIIRVMQPQLQTIDGVSEAQILNGKEYAMRVWLNPLKMVAHQVTPTELLQKLANNNTQTQAGHLTTSQQQFDITAQTSLTKADEFNQLALKTKNQNVIHIKDIGHAELGSKNQDVSGTFNGDPAIMVGINTKSNANPLSVSKLVQDRVAHLQSSLPPGLKMQVVWDNAKFINESLLEVGKTILIATLAVIAVIYLFLGSFRTVLIPAITIPLSLIGICALMLLMNYSLNTITLLALVLAIGLVVDDAIVVLENIHRQIEPGISVIKAALHGTREIRFAVIAMTLTLAAVYIPIGFTTGLVGQLFREFAFTLAGCVVISGIVSLTLSPMMCSKLLTADNERSNRLSLNSQRLFAKLSHHYHLALSWVLNKRRWAVGLCIAIYASCALLFLFIPRELTPTEDANHILSFVQGPATANLAYMEKYSDKIRQIYQQVPGYLADMSIHGWPNGANSAFSLLLLKNHHERNYSAMEIQQQLLPKLMSLPGVFAFPIVPSMLPGNTGHSDVSFVLTTTGSYKQLYDTMNQLMAKAHSIPYLFNLDSNLKMDKPTVHLSFKRDQVADFGIDMAAISQSLGTLLGEPNPSQFTMKGRSYEVIPQLMPQFRSNPETLKHIYIDNAQQQLVPLDSFLNIETVVGPQSLHHFQQQRSATLTANVWPGKLGTALTQLEQIAKQSLPPEISYDFADNSRRFLATGWTMTLTLVYALVFIFLVLAAQFESFRDPFIVLLSVPLAFTGAVLALFLFHGSLNIYTRIGLVTLIGLISKHGILMVEFANQQRAQGKNKFEAILSAATIRLRPILMTTAAMILGAMPLALASGAGAEVRQQIGWVIVGGMLIGTCFTLFAVPTAYTLFAKSD